MVESAWTTPAYSCNVRFGEHTGEEYLHVRMAACSKQSEKNEEERQSATLPAEGDCVLDFCLERDSYDGGYYKTNDDPFQSNRSLRACAMGCRYK